MTKTWLVVTKHPVRKDEWDPMDIEMGVAEVTAPTRREALKQGVRTIKEKHPDYYLMEQTPFSQVFIELISHCNDCRREFQDDEDIYTIQKPTRYNAHWHLCEPCYAKRGPSCAG